MKLVALSSLLIAGMLPLSNKITSVNAGKSVPNWIRLAETDCKELNLFSQSPENEKMLAVVFRKQDACRAELKDFEFDVQYKVVSATVYFSGGNFRNVEAGYINSNSLEPIKKLLERCVPGTMVVFDNVKVVGPDKLIRSIQGTSYLLH
jgi:hypothetical protein